MFRLPQNTFHGSEDDLVKAFIRMQKPHSLAFSSGWAKGHYYEQVRIPEVRRVSDLIVKCGRRLINVEFKLSDYDCVLSQAKSHTRWADYSYIAIPINLLAHLPFGYTQRVQDAGVGLIGVSGDTIVEVFKAKYQTYKAGKDREIRNAVKDRLVKKS